MSDVNKEVKQEETNSLAPIPEKDRIMGWGSNTMLWLGGCISIGTLAMGSAQMEAGLNRSSNWIYDPRCRYRNE